jgi:hypothetical protein
MWKVSLKLYINIVALQTVKRETWMFTSATGCWNTLLRNMKFIMNFFFQSQVTYFFSDLNIFHDTLFLNASKLCPSLTAQSEFYTRGKCIVCLFALLDCRRKDNRLVASNSRILSTLILLWMQYFGWLISFQIVWILPPVRGSCLCTRDENNWF